MSRRTIIAFAVATLLIGCFAAVAAVGTGGVSTAAITPEIHRVGNEGYFRLVLPLPDKAPIGPLSLVARVEEGDVYLVHAMASGQAREDQDEGEVAASPHGRTMTITGRFGKPGPARMTILARPAGGALKPLASFRFKLPAGDVSRPDVRQSWARQQQVGFQLADPGDSDTFSHYWNRVIAPRYGLSPAAGSDTTRFRRDPPDMYSVFTGAAAIQESLQLELLGNAPQSPSQRDAIKKAAAGVPADIPLATLAGPSVKSHPFPEMLKGKNPAVPLLSAYVPADQYAVFFTAITKQLELADLMDEWGGNLLRQVETSARDFKVREKLSRQLCLENSLLTRMFGDRVIGDMAFTGNDPFLKEGTAFTVIFSLKDRDRFRKQIEKNYREAARQGAVRSEFTIDGHQGIAAVSADRRISSYTLLLGNVAVVATSKEALTRIVAVADKRLPPLAQADDFLYMRTIFPQNAGEEDIFIYLSDPHIRALVSPRWKIGEARRMRCAGNMTLLANARLWFRAEQRREPTMAELVAGGYLGPNPPHCPDHGAYAIDKKGEPCCSVHNRAGHLTPVGEIPLERITPREAAEYKAFVENYNRYWTQFFDPIGIRVKLGESIRIQTCILPLIENSWYDGLVALSGRTQGTLTEAALLPRTVMSLRGHISPDWLRKTELVRALGERNGLDLGWLGDDVALNLCDGQVLFTLGGQGFGMLGHEAGRTSSLEPLVIGYLASALNLPTYLTVKVTDPVKAEESIPSLFRALGPSSHDDEFGVETYTLENHQGKPFYVTNFTLFVVKLRLYAAVVDDRLVIASRRDIITDLMDGLAIKGKSSAPQGSMQLSVYRSAFKELAEPVSLGYQEELRHACQKNLPLAAIMLKNLGVAPEQLESSISALRGYTPYCPAGGRYLVDPSTGITSCSVHGSLGRPRQPAAGDDRSPTLQLVNSLEKVDARLAFTPDGLMTTLEIRRKR